MANSPVGYLNSGSLILLATKYTAILVNPNHPPSTSIWDSIYTLFWPVMTSPSRPFLAAREGRRSDNSDNALRSSLHARARQWPRKIKLHPRQACSSTLFQMSRCLSQYLETEALSTLKNKLNIYVLINFGQIKESCLRQEKTDYFSGLLDVVQVNVSSTLVAALPLSPPLF